MYLGEVVRQVLLKLARETALFGSNVPPKLMTPYLLRYLSPQLVPRIASLDHFIARFFNMCLGQNCFFFNEIDFR